MIDIIVFDMIIVENGEEVVVFYKVESFDFVFMDIFMLLMDGM